MLVFKLSYSYFNIENVLSIQIIMFVMFHFKLNGYKYILTHFLVGLSDPVHFSRFVSIASAYKLRSRQSGFTIS